MNVAKLENALVTSKYQQAVELAAYFKSKGIDFKLVTKFALQVHPDAIAAAEKAMEEYQPNWRGDNRYSATVFQENECNRKS